MQVRVCAHVWRSENYIGSLQSCFTLFVRRQDLSLNLEPYDSARLASPQAPMICLCLPTSTGMTSAHQHAWHFRWVLRLELRSPCLHFNHFNDRAISSVPTGPILIVCCFRIRTYIVFLKGMLRLSVLWSNRIINDFNNLRRRWVNYWPMLLPECVKLTFEW